MTISSSNKKSCQTYSLSEKDKLNISYAYGSRYIQSPFNDQEKVLRMRRVLKSNPDEAFVR